MIENCFLALIDVVCDRGLNYISFETYLFFLLFKWFLLARKIWLTLGLITIFTGYFHYRLFPVALTGTVP